MLTPKRLPDMTADRARVDGLVTALQHEAAQAEADPFDDAMVAAVAGVAEVMDAQAEQMTALQEGMRRMARSADRTRRS